MSDREKQIEDAAHTLAHAIANPILRSMYPLSSRTQIYNLIKDTFKAGVKWGELTRSRSISPTGGEHE